MNRFKRLPGWLQDAALAQIEAETPSTLAEQLDATCEVLEAHIDAEGQALLRQYDNCYIAYLNEREDAAFSVGYELARDPAGSSVKRAA